MIWHPIRWTSLDPVDRVRLGDAIRNPVADVRADGWEADDAARRLADQLDAALAARGLRIDCTACVVGWVVPLNPNPET